MKTYRTNEQFEAMINNMTNGNWTDAAQNAVDFGIYASDIQRYIDNASDGTYLPDDLSDFMYITETAEKIRAKV